MTSDEILKVIKRHHSKDIVVPECKTGPTWYNNNLLRLDAWVMERSWINLNMIGYEIKISRGDFKADKKWKKYLLYCNQFYFICPWGMIKPEEIDNNDVGLCWISKNRHRMYFKKQSRRRDIEIPISLLLHIIINRSVIIRPQEFAMMKQELKKIRIGKDKRKC